MYCASICMYLHMRQDCILIDKTISGSNHFPLMVALTTAVVHQRVCKHPLYWFVPISRMADGQKNSY